MLLRLIASVGLFAVGYYLGHQVGKTEHLREKLAESRNEQNSSDNSKAEVENDETT